jgi:hypothetical protein
MFDAPNQAYLKDLIADNSEMQKCLQTFRNDPA